MHLHVYMLVTASAIQEIECLTEIISGSPFSERSVNELW
jgi:hypothetical protein